MSAEAPKEPEVGRLEATFRGTAFDSHGKHWDELWKDSFTPWDRGGPSLALYDLITERTDLIPASQKPENDGRVKKALVPGCGRGYDALLLAAMGYDTYGLDYSEKATREAIENEKKGAGEIEADLNIEGGQKGNVMWITGDFFTDAFLAKCDTKSFDLIFDYTFFCALPPEARAKWAKRMSQLLNPHGGRLICLEWPLHKDPSVHGPPWGLTATTYLAHLTFPGEKLPYDGNAPAAESIAEEKRDAAPDRLELLQRVKPKRTHKAGCDDAGNVLDFISVWAHPSKA